MSNEVFTKAADVLEAFGWIQGTFGNIESGFCALGAIGRAEDELGRIGTDLEPLHAAIRHASGGQATPSIVVWNDAPGRTQAEVVTALREAGQRA